MKNTHGRVLLSVKLQAPWVFFAFFKLRTGIKLCKEDEHFGSILQLVHSGSAIYHKIGIEIFFSTCDALCDILPFVQF